MPTPSYSESDLLVVPDLATPFATGYHPFLIPDPVDALGRRYFFFGPGQANLVYNGTTLKTMGIVAPQNLPTLSAIAGSITATPWVTYTYVDETDGVESGPAADLTTATRYQQTTLAAQGLRVVIPDPPAASSRVTHAYIYIGLLPDTLTMKYYGKQAVSPGSGGTYNVDIASLTNSTLEANDFLDEKTRYYSEGLPPATWTGTFWNGTLFLVDPDNPNIILYSEAALPENVPGSNQITINPTNEDPNPYIMALRNNQDRLYAYTRRGCYEIAGTAPFFKVLPAFSMIGTLSTSATRYVEGSGVVFPALDKVYVHVGGADIRPLGAPRSSPGANPIEDLYLASDMGLMADSVLVVDPVSSSVRFLAPENGDAAPDRTFVWEYDRSDWGMDTGRRGTFYGKWSDIAGRERLVRGDDLGAIWQDDIGNAEGVYGANFSDTVASATRNTVVGTTGFSASAVNAAVGAPVLLKNATTGEVLYRNRLLSYDSGTKTTTFLYPFTMADPDTDLTGLTVEVGSIEGVWQSGWLNLSSEGNRAAIHYIQAYLVKQAGGTIRVLCGVDQNTTYRLVTAAMSVAQHRDYLAFAEPTPNEASVRFDGSVPGTDWTLRGYALDITKKPSPR